MIEDKKKNEFWNFLTTEKNQPRPKGITAQRLAVIKPTAMVSDFWRKVIEQSGATTRSAPEFYQSGETAAKDSRTIFWAAVSSIILHQKSERKN